MSYKPLDKKRMIENIIEEEDTDIDEPILKKMKEEEEEATDIDEEEEATDIDEPIKTTTFDDNLEGHISSFKPLVLMIMTHGHIPCDDNDKYRTTTIPDGMELIKISISEAGLINCYDSNKSVDKYLIDVNEILPQLLNINYDERTERAINTYLNLWRESHSYVYIPMIQEDLNKRKTHKIKREIDISGLKYVEGYERGFKIHKLVSGDVVANKVYTREFKEKRKNNFSIIEMDRQINRLSYMQEIPEMPDLLSEIFYDETEPNDIHVINLEDILEHYKKLGITRLILFDFSCSTYVYTRRGRPKMTEDDYERIRKLNKDVPNGGNKKLNNKRKSCKKKSCKRKSYKRKSCKRKSHKRKYYKKKSYKK